MKRLLRIVALPVLLLAVLIGIALASGADRPPLVPPSFGEGFGERWHDGKAELAGYALRYPRYGQMREGTAVTIFVTEPFSKATRVKPELGPDDADDRFEVVKLNLVEDFPTGVYDYNMMTSVFVSTEPVMRRPAGSAVKVSFSSQEWCGHVYHQALLDESKVRETWHSYFDGEADGERRLDLPAGATAEDALFHWARGLAAPRLEPGESREVALMRSLAVSRLRHVPVEWDAATLSRSEGTGTIEVPAGEFEVVRYTAEVAPTRTEKLYGRGKVAMPGRSWRFDVEAAPPHRIVRWSRSDGVEAELLGSARMPYWQLNAEGGEKALEKIGLEPRGERMP